MFGYIAAGVLLFLAAALLIAAWVLSGVVLYPRKKTLEETEQIMVNEGSLAKGYYASLPREPFTVSTPEGALDCELIPAKAESYPPKVMILVHGYGFNRIGEVKYIPFFRKRGFHVVIFDNRNAGKSFKFKTTMGFYEAKDLSRIISWAAERFGSGALIGLHGESMGGAAVLMASAADERVSFVITDCPYADCADQLSYNLRSNYRLFRYPIIPMCSFFTKLRAGFYYSDASPIREIIKIKRRLPILFFHGTGDDFVPCAMTERMYAAYPGPKRVFYGRGSGHTFTSVDYPAEYDAEIGAFLAEFVPEARENSAENARSGD